MELMISRWVRIHRKFWSLLAGLPIPIRLADPATQDNPIETAVKELQEVPDMIRALRGPVSTDLIARVTETADYLLMAHEVMLVVSRQERHSGPGKAPKFLYRSLNRILSDAERDLRHAVDAREALRDF